MKIISVNHLTPIKNITSVHLAPRACVGKLLTQSRFRVA